MAKKKSHIKRAREDMEKLGTYKPEFESIIGVYAQLMGQYDALSKSFEDSGYEYFEYTNLGKKKAPIVTTLEVLRKDILSYASQLGLTPQGLLKTDENAFRKLKKNTLAEMLKDAPDE